jgi:hypothetical protein
MWRYLKAAFFARLPIPGLGQVPLNLLAVAAFAILGLGHPAFWLLGLGVETAFLFGLATNKRFQRAVDAQGMRVEQVDLEAQRRQLIGQLIPPARDRLAELEAKCARAIDISRRQGTEDFLLASNQDALDRLRWLYLKLLLGRQIMLSQENSASGSQLRRQIGEVQAELASANLPATLRDSKAATLKILERRVELFQRRGQAIAEIDADLERIEAQVDLAVENASLSAQPPALSGTITLASTLLEPELFGPAQSAVATLDETYHVAEREAGGSRR